MVGYAATQQPVFSQQPDNLLAYHKGYGSSCAPGRPRKAPLQLTERKHLNSLAMVLAMVIPAGIFAATAAGFAFSELDRSTLLPVGIALVALLIPAFFWRLSRLEAIKKLAGDPYAEPSWYRFMASQILCAWVCGVVFGLCLYEFYMRAFHDIAELRTYMAVDPSANRGQQMMDAGQVIFRKGSHIDLTKAMAFTNTETYCVAPITIGDAPLASYDFWAVGTNCCEGITVHIGKGLNGHYSCGEYDNPHASAGLRLMDTDAQSFYHIAVQQAQATYGFEAVHPLFFHWTQDPLAKHEAQQAEGFRKYMIGLFWFGVVELVLVLCTVSSLYEKPMNA